VGEIDMPNPDRKLTSGMFVTVDVHYGESEEATLIPLSALFENPATGATGIYVTKSSLDREPVGQFKSGESTVLTEPVPFEFVAVDVLARGRMEAGIRGAEKGDWVITLGQNLLAGQPGEARVRPVKWEWVDKLQNLQREDLMEEVVKKQQAVVIDTVSSKE
jgi:multidrug efflux pump subunit AcrA (membrane-fusion protein)